MIQLAKFQLSRQNPGRTCLAIVLACISAMPSPAQTQTLSDDPPNAVPVLSGSVGFIPFFDGGHATLVSIVSPVLLVPIGQKWLVESRAAFEGDFTRPDGGGPFGGKIRKELEYLQLDYIANPYVTITAGRYLTPFGLYNERLYPIWIRNLQADPLILPLGTGSSDGVMLRGGIAANAAVTVNYTAYFSTLSTVNRFESDRQVGGRFGFFFPHPRIEIGASLQHLLQDARPNRFGFHFEWQPPPLPLDVRAEYANSESGHGFWIEPAYRLSQLPFWHAAMSRTQVVARLQQFVLKQFGDGSLPGADTREVDFGANYYLRDGLKATASYGRRFSSDGNANGWTVGMTYRFTLPLLPGGTK